MSRAARVAGLAIFGLAVSCGGELISGPAAPPPAPLQLQVDGTSCEGAVFYTVGGIGTGPDGQLADFPYAIGFQAASGDAVTLRACNTCVLACPTLPCDVTIRTTIVWQGRVLATSESTGPADPSCLPETAVAATIP